MIRRWIITHSCCCWSRSWNISWSWSQSLARWCGLGVKSIGRVILSIYIYSRWVLLNWFIIILTDFWLYFHFRWERNIWNLCRWLIWVWNIVSWFRMRWGHWRFIRNGAWRTRSWLILRSSYAYLELTGLFIFIIIFIILFLFAINTRCVYFSGGFIIFIQSAFILYFKILNLIQIWIRTR